MYRIPKSSGSIYSTEDSNEANNGCNNDTSDSDTHKGKNVQCPCPPKKSFTRLICNLIGLSLITPFCLVKRVCITLSRASSVQKVVSWVSLFLLFFGATYMGLFDGKKFQIFGEEWRDFSICDLIQGETQDLRSLIKANNILERKALEIAPLKEQVNKLQLRLHDVRSDMKDIAHHAVSKVLEGYTSKGITRWSIEKMLKKLMEKLDEDDVQMPDYALKSAGANIVQSRTTRSYRHDGGKYFWMSFVMLPFVRSPDVILEPNYHPGNCWSFPGNQGEAVVRLAKEIIPKSVTIEHISKKVSPTGEISSAPKDFAIYGLKEEKEEQGTFLGQFLYDTEGDLIQTFQLKNESSESMSYVKLKVLSNWGHPNYTCIYRFRVHGNLQYI